jgi:hypothetical protein
MISFGVVLLLAKLGTSYNQTNVAMILAALGNRTFLKEILQVKGQAHNMASALQAFGHLYRKALLT